MTITTVTEAYQQVNQLNVQAAIFDRLANRADELDHVHAPRHCRRRAAELRDEAAALMAAIQAEVLA